MQFKVFLALPNIHHHNQARLQQEKPWGCIQLCSHVVFISHELVISYVRALFALFLLVQQSQCKFSTFVPVELYSTRSEMWVLCREDRVAQTKAFSAEELWRWAEASEGINTRTSRLDSALIWSHFVTTKEKFTVINLSAVLSNGGATTACFGILLIRLLQLNLSKIDLFSANTSNSQIVLCSLNAVAKSL